MAIMLGKLYDALRSAPDEAKALEAAQEVASYDSRLAAVETKLAVLTAMVTANIGLTLLVLGKVW